MLKNKKGIALNQAFGAVLTLILVAVLVIIAIFLFVSLNTSFAGTATGTMVNETIADVNETGTLVANSTLCEFGSFSVDFATNATSGDVISSDNYTVGASTGLVSYAGVGDFDGFNSSDWNITGSFTWGSEACTAGDDMVTQFATYPILIGLVGTIIFLGLVIGVLVASFVFGRREGV
jgi:hypothetical protein